MEKNEKVKKTNTLVGNVYGFLLLGYGEERRRSFAETQIENTKQMTSEFFARPFLRFVSKRQAKKKKEYK